MTPGCRSEPRPAPSARPSPDENREPSETGGSTSRRSPFDQPPLKARMSRSEARGVFGALHSRRLWQRCETVRGCCRPGRGRSADHAQESALAAEAVEREKQAAAKRKKQAAAIEEEPVAPSKRQRKPPRAPSGRTRRKGGSDQPRPPWEASPEVEPAEDATRAPSHAGGTLQLVHSRGSCGRRTLRATFPCLCRR